MKVELRVLIDIGFIEAVAHPLPRDLRKELAHAAADGVWRALKDAEGEGFEHRLADATSMVPLDIDIIRPKFMERRGPKEWAPEMP